MKAPLIVNILRSRKRYQLIIAMVTTKSPKNQMVIKIVSFTFGITQSQIIKFQFFLKALLLFKVVFKRRHMKFVYLTVSVRIIQKPINAGKRETSMQKPN